jgi:formylglycine-generating enzyme required for sulfatase activity
VQADHLQAALAGRYRIERELGRGGMAVVYLALDLKHDRQVAIKVLLPDLVQALGSERFLREIKLTAKLSHPHILPLLDSGDAGGLLYYVMPYVEGESLRARLNREKRLSLDEALAVTREVADALDSAHRHGVVHRDIKPENILLAEGHAVIADFGIARAIAESAGDRVTATGLAIGTPAYMSPEQIRGNQALDARTDLYSLGCVTYEMLAGEPPFAGPTAGAIFARRLTEPPPRVTQIREAVPEHVDRALRRALAESPDQRFSSAAEFLAALGPPPTAEAAPVTLRALVVRRPYTAGALGVALLALVALVVASRFGAGRARARDLLPRIAQLADSGRWVEAYTLATKAERELRDDSALTRLMATVADRLTITSEPAGALVYLQRVPTDSSARIPDSAVVGQTPIRELRTARGDYRVVLVENGFAPAVRIASSAWRRAEAPMAPPRTDTVSVRLTPAPSTPPGMVFVPGGRYQLLSPDAPAGLAATLDDYWFDQYEVSNADFKRFIVAGGYAKADYWLTLAADRSTSLAETVVRREFTDRTGLPGPRSWTGQEFPAGRDRYPVSDITWYEASAFCAFQGKALPSVFQWEKAALNGASTFVEGMMMPWGYSVPGPATAVRANFNGAGPAPVDAYPFGVSVFGAYNMAGNGKEWTANPAGNGYVVTGGSWEDPSYLYRDLGVQPPTATAPTVGFRCARVTGPASGDEGASRVPLERRTPAYRPVDPATFRAFLTYYRYDRRPLDARVVDSAETPGWLRLKVRFMALEDDTALAYLYLPNGAAPPFQTIVYVTSVLPFRGSTVPADVEWAIGPCIKAGRAVLAVVFKGMEERGFGPGWTPPEPSSVRFRDLMVLHATELRRGMDYLETRSDVDRRKLAYVGLSWGAGSRLVFAAVDDRYRAVVLIGGGIDERVQPTQPQAANFNFAPYIKAPKLLLNGREDEEHPWLTRALPLWNLLQQPKKLVLVEGAGHVPPLQERVPAINRFLDETLGPVLRR